MDSFNGWTVEQTRRLFKRVAEVSAQGLGLKTAFEDVAAETGRKPNSVRNYYYSQAKTLSLVPDITKNLGISEFRAPQKAGFTTFTPAEVEELITYILREQAKGRSVRAITTERAHGDKTVMLRLQNKYRSVVFARKKFTQQLMEKLRKQGVTFYNPYTRRIAEQGIEPAAAGDSVLEGFKKLGDTLPDEDVRAMLGGIARLATLAAENSGHLSQAKNDLMRKELETLRLTCQTLRDENERLLAMRKSSGMRYADAVLDAQGSKLKKLNEYFLAKEDSDKIKSLGEYVSELGKILGKTSGGV